MSIEVVVMGRKPQFLSERREGNHKMTNKVVLVLKIQHFLTYRHSQQDLDTVKSMLENYLSRVLNTRGNPMMEIELIVWGEPHVSRR